MNKIEDISENSLATSLQRIPRTLRVLAGLTGLTMLSGCMDSSASEYTPSLKDTCAIVVAGMIEPGYEADRWSNDTEERDRIEEEIFGSVQRIEGAARYAVCVDDKQKPHVADVDRIAYLAQFFGTDDQGIDIAGLAVPTIITPEEFENRFQSEIDPGHGF